MNFFEYQDRTRRNTKLLVFLFILAVLLIIASIYYSCWTLVFFALTQNNRPEFTTAPDLWNPTLFGWVAAATLLVVIGGSLYMTSVLSGGGKVVAERLGGREVPPNATDLNEKRLRNIVEEMAIASGTPVPGIYVLPDETGINAFAAGFTPSDAVVAVTQGSLDYLNREELQGVIAHEFSHVVNGDSRLNIRLSGVIHGILVIGLTGYWIMRILGRTRTGSNRKGGGAIAALFLFGAAICAIGYIGVFFGRVIKAGVSRQRERLADASAVQFTRNPLGLVGALLKIGGVLTGSKVKAPHAEEASHMFFANGLRASFLSLMSTHPPLEERIRALDPTFRGRFPDVQPIALAEDDATAAFTPPPVSAQVRGQDVVRSVGQVTAKHLTYAASFLPSLPSAISTAIHSPAGAKGLVYSMVLDSQETVANKQLEFLRTNEAAGVLQETLKLKPILETLGPQARLPLVDLALPALRQLPQGERDLFWKSVMALIKADECVSMHEFVLVKVLTHHLGPVDRKANRGSIKYRALDPLLPHVQLILSALSHTGNPESAAAQKAYLVGFQRLTAQPLPLLSPDRCEPMMLHRSFIEMAQASPSIKREFLDASAATVGADGQVTPEEAELLRAIGDTLDCPIPPILAAA